MAPKHEPEVQQITDEQQRGDARVSAVTEVWSVLRLLPAADAAYVLGHIFGRVILFAEGHSPAFKVHVLQTHIAAAEIARALPKDAT